MVAVERGSAFIEFEAADERNQQVDGQNHDQDEEQHPALVSPPHFVVQVFGVVFELDGGHVLVAGIIDHVFQVLRSLQRLVKILYCDVERGLGLVFQVSELVRIRLVEALDLVLQNLAEGFVERVGDGCLDLAGVKLFLELRNNLVEAIVGQVTRVLRVSLANIHHFLLGYRMKCVISLGYRRVLKFGQLVSHLLLLVVGRFVFARQVL